MTKKQSKERTKHIHMHHKKEKKEKKSAKEQALH